MLTDTRTECASFLPSRFQNKIPVRSDIPPYIATRSPKTIGFFRRLVNDLRTNSNAVRVLELASLFILDNAELFRTSIVKPLLLVRFLRRSLSSRIFWDTSPCRNLL